ncbi:MAG: EAL domain-containing protein [Thiobacillus sp.]|nr:EAL domain-containing protein [Thiobacillus sp.]
MAQTAVLVLHSYNLEYPWTKRQHEAFVGRLDTAGRHDLAVSTESLDTKRIAYSPEYARVYADFLRIKYAGYKPALIYVTDDNALLFARDHLARLFPDSPVFFSGVNDLGVLDWLDPVRMSGVFEKKEVAPNLALIRRIDAGARRILLVGDGSNTYRAIEREARKDLAQYPDIQATFVADSRIESVLAALQNRPEKYLFLTTLGGMTDAEGRILPLREAIGRIAALGRYVIFSMEDAYQFDGVLGGYVTSGIRQGREAAGLALAYLDGRPMAEIAPIRHSPNAYLFDAGYLARLGIELPAAILAEAELVNRPVDFIDEHRGQLVAAVYILLAALFAVVLAALAMVTRKNRLLNERARQIGVQSDALRASEESYRGLFNSINEAIYVQDENGVFLDVNQGAERMYGYRRAEMIGQDPAFVSAPGRNDLGKVAERFAKALAGEPQQFEFWGLRKDGEAFPKDVWLTQGHYFGRKVVIAVAADITLRKQAEAQLQIAATAFESQEATVITDADQIIQRVNRAFTRVTGYSAEEVIGKTPALLSSGRQDAAFYRAMWSSLAETGQWQGEIWNRRKGGEIYPEWLTITAVFDDGGRITNYVGMFQDITDRKSAEERIRNLAFYDALTQLPNRRLLMDRMHQAIVLCSRNRRHGALLFIDLDNFKLLNDTQGHDVGDLLLVSVARRLQACVREGDTVARLGGDEFVVMLEDLDETAAEAANQVEGVAIKIHALLNQPYQLGPLEHHSSPSIGVALFRDKADAIDELLKRADLAMYQAKASGRNTIRFFDPAMQAAVEARSSLEAELRRAVRQDEFKLVYQPQVDGNGRIVAVEALARWHHPERGLVAPLEFIPLAEETGLIVGIGQQLLLQACEQIRAWSAQPGTARWSVSVNVSPRQFHHPDFVDMVLAAVDAAGIAPDRLMLEITEGILLDDLGEAAAKMTALKRRGIRFSIDDFGTGYSSLAYLKRLPLDELKIDRSFVADVGQDDSAGAICAAFISLAHMLGLRVVAEGVETEAQHHFLATLHGCDTLQGYYFNPPLAAAELVPLAERPAF